MNTLLMPTTVKHDDILEIKCYRHGRTTRPFIIVNNIKYNTVSMYLPLNKIEMDNADKIKTELVTFLAYDIITELPTEIDVVAVLKNDNVCIDEINGYLHFHDVSKHKLISDYYPNIPVDTINSILSARYECDNTGNVYMTIENCERICDEISNKIDAIISIKTTVLTNADIQSFRNKYKYDY